MLKVTNREVHLAILKKFMSKYVKEGTKFRDEQGTRTLLWTKLKDEYRDNYILISTNDIPKIGLHEDLSMYVYLDRTEELYTTTFTKFYQYLENREVWEDIDAEVFDDTLDWLVVITHDDVSMLFGFDDDE